MTRYRFALFLFILTLVAAFFLFDLGQYLSLDYLKSQRDLVAEYYRANSLETAAIFFLVYIAVTSLSLPGATILTLAAGAIFGLVWGTVIVSLASTIGATIAFLTARFLFRDYVQKKFTRRLATINKGIEKDGAFYLFTLRLIPIFPFFVINLVMGLTPLRLITYFLVSWIGMLGGTIVYVNAGTQLAQIEAPGDILSLDIILAFTLLGIFPLLAKKVVEFIRARRVYRAYDRPPKFNRNLVVIGAGSAGLVAAYIAATVRARVTLIEKNKMGGDCLNTGCVPSKALIRSARFISLVKRAGEFGIKSASVDFNFADIMERVQRVITTIEPHDSVERYTELGVECIQGKARITSPWSVTVNNRTLTTRNIIIATGANPFVPPIKGLDQMHYYTSDTIWELRELPKRLLVLGGGPIGSELSQCFARFGSKVSQIEMLPRLLAGEDPEISDRITDRFREEGIDIRTGHRAVEIRQENGRKTLLCDHDGNEVIIPFDEILVAVGRQPNTRGFGLEELGIPLTEQGAIEVNQYLQTCYPNIFACGDVAGPYQYTHTASHQAWYASVNALFGRFKRFRADYSVIPRATFTDPEVARVGLNEQDAKEQDIDYEVTTYGIEDLDRAITDEEAHGLVKVLTVPGKDTILGVTIVGEHAADLITEYISAMRHGIGLDKILSTIHIYPTLAEANKFAAGNWKKAHAPKTLLAWVGKYHNWIRG